jgi:hypothetical protein
MRLLNRANAFGKILTIAALCAAFSGITALPALADTTTITIDLGPPRAILTPQQIAIPFSDLSGIPLNGGTDIIDVLFSGDESIFTPDSTQFDTELAIDTPGSTCPGFASGTGTYLRKNGAPLFTPIALGSADECGSTGEIAVGIEFPPLSGRSSIYGFQFDLTLPNDPGATLGNGNVLISINDPYPEVFIEPLPEPSSLSLLGIGLMGIAGLAAIWKRKPLV